MPTYLKGLFKIRINHEFRENLKKPLRKGRKRLCRGILTARRARYACVSYRKISTFRSKLQKEMNFIYFYNTNFVSS